ncbi:MAG: hypothetical protein HETSPECPRED_005725 [Heterodermia speciosa]|uniref:Uncharacterized protein n=1 Tax=Heterodermia speciosa TaxID=116794 RepID=A0A8H3FPT9_9LECA|nr:MAG: hypothetical protein HETSPECPRED_005725 [Heterodermia speciosa]
MLGQDRATKDISPILAEEFRRGFDLINEGHNSETWLRVAVWWLIKARIVSEALPVDSPSSRDVSSSQLPTWESTVSHDQAHLDKLKSAWILEEVVLKAPSSDNVSRNKIKGLVLDLARSLDGDLTQSRHRPSIDHLLKLDVGLFESFEQPVEAWENIPKAMDDPDTPHRWLTVDPGNGGRDPENIIYRT